jgi:hypothetical protein
MRAQVNPVIADKLAALRPKEPEKPKTEVIPKTKEPDKPRKERQIDWDSRVILSIGVLPRPDKQNCAWAFIGHGKGYYSAAVLLNTLLWPVNGAITRGDKQAVRWLFSVAMLERLFVCTPSHNPELTQARHQIIESVIPKYQGFEKILWAAYLLKDHPITSALNDLPIYGEAPKPGPHLVAEIKLEKPKEVPRA